jgi:hypothetical protein
MLPPLCVRERVVAYPVPELKEISKLVGAVIVASADKLAPDTVMLWALDDAPEMDENADRVPETKIVGPEIK